MVFSDTFSVQRYVSTIPEKNQCKSISFEAKHIFRLSFVSTSCIYWVQKRIMLIHSWCMQFSWLQNDTKNMVWNLGRKIQVQKYYRVELTPGYINKNSLKGHFSTKILKHLLRTWAIIRVRTLTSLAWYWRCTRVLPSITFHSKYTAVKQHIHGKWENN